MSILETFIYSFKADTANAQRNIERVEDSVDSAGGAIKKAGGAVKEFAGEAVEASGAMSRLGPVGEMLQKAFAAIPLPAKLAAIAVIGVAAQVELLRRGLDDAKEFGEFAREMGLSTQRVTQLQLAMQDAGVSAETFKNSLRKVHEAIHDPTSDAAMLMRRQGIKFREGGSGLHATAMGAKAANLSLSGKTGARPVDEVMQQLANKMGGMSEKKALIFGTKLGIDPETIAQLRKGGDAWRQMVADQKEASEAMAEARRQQMALAKDAERLGSIFTTLRAKFVDAFATSGGMDAFREMIKQIGNYFKANSDTFSQPFRVLGESVGQLLVALEPFFSILGKIVIVLFNLGTVAAQVLGFIIGGLAQLVGLASEGWREINNLTDGFWGVGDAIKEAASDSEMFWLYLKRLGYDIIGLMASLSDEIIKSFSFAFNTVMQKYEDLVNYIIEGINTVANTSIDPIKTFKIDPSNSPAAQAAQYAADERVQVEGQMAARRKQMEREKAERQKQRDQLNEQEQISNHTVDNAREVAKQQEMGTLSLEQYFALWAGKRGQEENLMKSGGVTDVAALIHGQQQLGIAPIAKGKEELTTSRYMPIPPNVSNQSRQVNVTTGPIEIHTRSTDPQAINQHLAQGLAGEMQSVMKQFDDGLDA